MFQPCSNLVPTWTAVDRFEMLGFLPLAPDEFEVVPVTTRMDIGLSWDFRWVTLKSQSHKVTKLTIPLNSRPPAAPIAGFGGRGTP